MAYEVQPILITSLDSILLPDPPLGSREVQKIQIESAIRTVSFPNSTQTPLLSNVKIKRPDGTWANTVQVVGVHVRKPDGTWETFI